jgi:hypothetical protein
MKFAKPLAAGSVPPTLAETSAAILREARMFCLDDGVTLDALFTFAAFVLVFAIGLGPGLLTRGP